MALIIDGRPTTLIPDGDLVTDNLVFFPGSNKNTRAMKVRPSVIVHHWTGAENPIDRVIKTLQARDLSIHFVGSKDGSELRQTADVTTRCAHAGTPINDRSIGFEWVSRGFARKEDLRGQGLRERTELDWSEPRDTFRARWDGRATNLASFYPLAIERMLWITETLCGLLMIPRLIPFELVSKRPQSDRMWQLAIPDGLGKWAIPLFDRDARKWWPRSSRPRAFKGVVGHAHVHDSKWDPGPQPFWALWAEGFNPTGRKILDWTEAIR